MMNVRAIIFVVAALVAVGATIFFVRSYLDAEARRAALASKKDPVKPKARIEVLVAKVNLPAGTFLNPKHFAWQAWPDETLHPTYIRRQAYDQQALVGAVVRRGIAAGEPITDTRVVRPGERGFMAAVLTPGMRAVTVSINKVTGVAGFAFPGDRVDILLTHTLRSGPLAKHVATETLLTDVRILAIDQRTDDQNKQAKVGKTVTIEVTPKQAEVLAVADNLGRLSLTLRSLGHEERLQEGVLTAGATVLDLDELINRPPSRGRTHTFDSETSRLLSTPENTVDVMIVRGNKRSQIRFPKVRK